MGKFRKLVKVLILINIRFCFLLHAVDHGLILRASFCSVYVYDYGWAIILVEFSGGKEDYIPYFELSHGFKLVCASGTPAYTNYVSSFKDCLDYIFVDSERLQPIRVVPMPTHDEVIQYTALPNVVFPSDHIALVCDVAWLKNTQN